MIELPVTYLKLDRSVVTRLPADPQARALVQAVLMIAGSMGLVVVGEGVETAGQAEYLTQAGCHLQQGFHHGRPQPADHLTATLARHTATRVAVGHSDRTQPQPKTGSAEDGNTLDAVSGRESGAAS